MDKTDLGDTRNLFPLKWIIGLCDVQMTLSPIVLIFTHRCPGDWKSIVVKPLALSCRCHMCGHDNWQYANTAIFCNFPSAWRLLFTKVAKLYNSQHFQSPSFKLRDQCDAGEVEVVIHSNWPIGSASMAPKLGLASLHNAIQKLLQKLIQMQIQIQIQTQIQ